MRLTVLQNDAGVPPGHLGRVARERGIEVDLVALDAGEPVPDVSDIEALVVLGGEMGAYDGEAYPYLDEEKELLRAAVAGDIPVLGLCLGCQLLADALGGRAYLAPAPEVILRPVDLLRPDPVVRALAEGPALSMHRDTWTVPEGGELIATSDTYNQAFRIGSALGVQPHPEVERVVFHDWIDHPSGGELLRGAGADRERLRERFDAEATAMRRATDRFLPCVVRRGRDEGRRMILDVLVFVVGLAMIVYVVQGAIRTVVLPRAARPSLSNWVFRLVIVTMKFIASRRKRYEDQDAILAAISPTGLVLVPLTWIVLVLVGFTLMFWATEPDAGWGRAYHLSGSSITTLGFAPADGVLQRTIAFAAAILGLLLITLLITYLPSIYSGFQHREQKVALLEVRAGSPPAAEEMLTRFHRIGWLDEFSDEFLGWEEWFAELEETHTTHPSLPWFRSTVPTRSWVTAAGTVLDCAAIWTSSVAGLTTSQHASAALTIRAGFISLRRIGDVWNIAYDPDPEPSDPITIQRAEFDQVLDDLAARGVPLIDDRDQAWHDFSGWRVNYDSVLLGLADMLRVPYAPWTSDRFPLEVGHRSQR